MKIDGDVFIREKIDLNYTIIVKELKQELKVNRVELPQPPLKTNLERTIYDTCLMSRTKGNSIKVSSSIKYDENNGEYIFEYNENDNIDNALQWMKNYIVWNERIARRRLDSHIKFTTYLDNYGRYILKIGACDIEKAVDDFVNLIKNYENLNLSEADGLSPTASGKEGEDLSGFSSGEFPSSIHPVEEKEASAETPWSLKELLEEDSFTISSIDQMEEEENVGVLPNISEYDGEMSAPTSSRDNREMSAPIVSRNNEEMSALNIPDATWMAAIKGACQANIQTRKSIIAEVLKPQFVMPSIGSKVWHCLEVLLNQERKRYDVLRRLSPNVETRENAQRMKIILDKFCRATSCGAFSWTRIKEKKRYVKTLLKDI